MLRTPLATTKEEKCVHNMKWIRGHPPFNLGPSVIQTAIPKDKVKMAVHVLHGSATQAEIYMHARYCLPVKNIKSCLQRIV